MTTAFTARRAAVYATTTTTELFFRQAVGRIVRWVPGHGHQPSYMFMPDDPRLRAHAIGIAEERRHFLKTAGDGDEGDGLLDEVLTQREDEQMSLFCVVSATPSGEVVVHRTDEHLGLFGSLDDDAPDEDGFELQLLDAPHLEVRAPDDRGLTPVQRRRMLRDANALMVRAIAAAAAMTHAQVNGDLNRMSKVRSVSEASADDLERRRHQAAKWLERIGARAGGR